MIIEKIQNAIEDQIGRKMQQYALIS